MELYLVGLGLGNIEDLTIFGINVINLCSKLYLFDSKYYPFNQKILVSWTFISLIFKF